MSRQTFARVKDETYEIQRLRLLLAALEQRKKSRAVLVELTAAPKGFQLIVTAPSDAQEQALAGLIGDRLIELAAGALNFTAASFELSPSVDAVDPAGEKVTE